MLLDCRCYCYGQVGNDNSGSYWSSRRVKVVSTNHEQNIGIHSSRSWNGIVAYGSRISSRRQDYGTHHHRHHHEEWYTPIMSLLNGGRRRITSPRLFNEWYHTPIARHISHHNIPSPYEGTYYGRHANHRIYYGTIPGIVAYQVDRII